MLIVAKVLNMKDKLQQQILAALLYKKTIIWTDLKIEVGASRDNDVIYAAEKVVEVRNRIDEFMATKGYLPKWYTYQSINSEDAGYYTTFSHESEESDGGQGNDFTQLVEAIIDSNGDMETLIKEKYLFSQEKIAGFLETNPVQKTLREQVEMLNEMIQELQEKDRLNNERLEKQEKNDQSDAHNL